MLPEGREGWIEVITGVMFSGKSEELMRRVRRATIAGKSVAIFTSHLDARYDGDRHVSSHDGGRVEAVPISRSGEIAGHMRPGTDVVAVDEAQFLDSGIVDVADVLADQGRRVVLAGTDMDFRGLPFGPLPHLLAVAEKIDKLHAVCVRCGELATRNQRLVDGEPAPAEGPLIQVGGASSYEARCRECHEVPSRTDAQMRLLDDLPPRV